jgi:hypothetical protein
VSVTVEVPGATVLIAVSVSTLLPVIGFGENEAPTPVGSPEMARWTLPVNPYSGFTVTVDATEDPAPRVTGPGTVNVKVG